MENTTGDDRGQPTLGDSLVQPKARSKNSAPKEGTGPGNDTEMQASSDQATSGTKKFKAPKVFYTSRTHSQLAQVVRELKRTTYKPTMVILASRSNYCVHKSISKAHSVDEECQKLLADPDKNCDFFAKSSKLRGSFEQVHDIEDLVKAGKKHKGCPYYAARQAVGDAELVFCPYSYILDPVVRRAMDINLEDAVVIFDEAHNIEEVQAAFQNAAEAGVLPEVHNAIALNLSRLLQWMQAVLDAGSLKESGFERYEKLWNGWQALKELEAAGLSPQNIDELWSNYLQARKSDEEAGPGDVRVGGGHLGTLCRLAMVLQLMYKGGPEQCNDYRLVVSRRLQRVYGAAALSAGGDSAPAAAIPDGMYGRLLSAGLQSSTWVVQFGLWLLNPAVAFAEVQKAAHSVVVTSGTLSPTASFASELDTVFVSRLEAPHVVNVAKQFVAVAREARRLVASIACIVYPLTRLSAFPLKLPMPCAGGFALSATFKNADTFPFQDHLGEVVQQTCEVVPHGVLVFLPSYSILDRLQDRWKSTGTWSRILESKSRLVAEPKGSGKEFDKVLKEYYAAVESGDGAVLLAVCRGKVSEGVDFANNNARGVIIVGIPFPNVKDSKVNQKKQYNYSHQGERGLLSGDDWAAAGATSGRVDEAPLRCGGSGPLRVQWYETGVVEGVDICCAGGWK
eukprot:gene2667-3437_t